MTTAKRRRIAIVGARIHGRPDVVREHVRSLAGQNVELVSGGAPGVDTWAEEEARKVGLPVRIHRPRGNDRAAFLARDAVIAKDDLAELYAYPWRGSSGTQYTAKLAVGEHVYVEFRRPTPFVDVWTTRLGSGDPDELDITCMSARARVDRTGAGAVFVRLRALYQDALAAEHAGQSLLAIQRSTPLTLGHPWAPSHGLLAEALAARQRVREAGAAGDWDLAERLAVEAWDRYVNGDGRGPAGIPRGFTAEMRESLKHNALAWGWALARPLRGTSEAPEPGRLVVACFCRDHERCHRTLVARMLGAMGATVRGEIPSSQLSLLPTTDPETPETDSP